jgi:CSLREA domain-containing protein
VSNSTITNNSSTWGGGAIYEYYGATHLINSTLSGNIDSQNFGGYYGNDILYLKNTILANNTGTDCYNDGGTIQAGLNNLIKNNGGGANACGTPTVTADPNLGALANNGGLTQTMAINKYSAAINAGDTATCAAAVGDPNYGAGGADQRGQARAAGGCDIGAYEYQPNLQSGSTFTVTKTADTNSLLCEVSDCSLREAITAANNLVGADTITAPAGTYTLTIAGAGEDANATGDLDIRSDVTINGAGASSAIIQASVTHGAGIDRVFEITNNATTVNISGVTIANGKTNLSGGGIQNWYLTTLTVTNSAFSGNSADAGGGGIHNTGILNVTSSTFSGNTGYQGGGILNFDATLTVTNSTFSGNLATYGGGIYNWVIGTLNVTNSAFSGNSASTNGGGGIFNIANTFNLKNMILANSTSGGDCYNDGGDTIATNTNNLIETNGPSGHKCGTPSVPSDPQLGTLTGSPAYFPLLSTSPAINAGNQATCNAAPVSNASQNNRARNLDASCDIGAYEYAAGPTVLSSVRANADPTSSASVDFTVTFSEDVTGVDAADFKLTNAAQTGASIASVTPVSGIVYTVTANTGQNGAMRLDVLTTATIQGLVGNSFVGPYIGGETYMVNKGAAPTVPLLVSPATGLLVTNTPTLDWGTSSEVMALANPWSYEVNITALGGYNRTFNTAGNADSFIGLGDSSLTIQPADALPENATFTWKVRSYNNANQYSAWSLLRTFRTKLGTPVLNLPANGVTLNNKRPTFEWDAVPGATGYTLQIMIGTTTITGTIIAPANTYTPAADLLRIATYTWKVKANGINAGDYSAPFTFTTSDNALKPPLLSAPPTGALVTDTATQPLTWFPVATVITASPATTYPAALSYQVQYATNSAFNGATLAPFVNDPTVTLNIPTLPGRTYYWRVRSWSGMGATGNYSAWSLTRTIKVKFVAPTLGTVTNLVGGKPTFTWNSTNGFWTSYTITVTKAFTTTVRTFTVPAPYKTYTIPASLARLAAGDYYWKVTINGLYVAIPSAVSVSTFHIAP